MDTILFLTMVLKFDNLTYTKMREISPYIQKRKNRMVILMQILIGCL